MQLIETNNYEFGLEDILTPKTATILRELPEDVLAMSEEELILAGKVNELDWKIRIRFWQEFRTIMDPRARGTRVPKMKMTNIYEGLCDALTFSKKFDNVYKAAFFFRPMSDFEEETEMVLQLGAKRLWEIMTMDIMGKNGKVDAKLASVLLSAIGLAADRSRGLALMRTQSLNVNIDKKSSEATLSAVSSISDPFMLDKKIKELEAKLGKNTLVIEGETVGSD
jgi:hypothetical protein